MSKKSEAELSAARSLLKNMQKGTDDSNATIVELRSENRKLADKFDTIVPGITTKFVFESVMFVAYAVDPRYQMYRNGGGNPLLNTTLDGTALNAPTVCVAG